MINITDKRNCCGCTACQHICPKKCISMQEDEEGFLYPLINISSCINCHLCERVCPSLNRFKSSFPTSCFASKSLDESLRLSSSSGGIFSLLANKIIENKGIVFGARFMNDWTVAHDYTASREDLFYFRGSKYVQSYLGDSFIKVKQYLNDGRLVLFSGTPCQVAGLNHFLSKKYQNLITIDIVCHSISSPLVWKKYLDEICNGGEIKEITFRDKSLGWYSYALKICGKDSKGNDIVYDHGSHNQNPFMRGFLENLTVRPSCFNCPARNYVTGSDIMLADFWHLNQYHPDWDDNKGMSLALVLSEKGRIFFDSCKNNLFREEISYNEVEDHGVHSPITMSTPPNPYRLYFFSHLKNEPIIPLLKRCLKKYEIKRKRQIMIRRVIKYSGLGPICRLLKQNL